MPSSVKEMMAAASAAVPKIGMAEAQALIDRGNVLVVDVREGSEVAATGKAAGALHAPRSVLEFRADPESPLHDKGFQQGQDRARLLRVRRPRGACRQAVKRFRLQGCAQPRRLQGLGRGRRQGGEDLIDRAVQ